MYAYIKGTLEEVAKDYLVVEAGGIGYRIFSSMSTISALPSEGSTVKIYTYLQVREDEQSLYGFLTNEELNMFELLITVTGVGPKAALSILSTLSASAIGLAVITNDVKALTRAPGVGPKMAQRILLELRDKIRKEQLESAGSQAGFVPEESGSEAVNALMVLGYSSLEATRAVEKVLAAASPDQLSLEDTIRESLKLLSK